MKIILSRKGFDSANGGIPSPIIVEQDGTARPCSLPIPLQRATCGYDDIQWNGSNLLELISSLNPRIGESLPNTPHLDPDLNREALRKRHTDWRPIFGQSGAQETQLQNMGVHDPGDPSCMQNRRNRPLFLFFGWYKEAYRNIQGYSYRRGAPSIHALFGWLQVERKILLVDRERVLRELPWTAQHPHVACEHYDGHGPNAVYVAPKPGSETDRLILGGHDTGLPAAGLFRCFNPDAHTLSRAGEPKSIWRLPAWFYRQGHPTLGMHQNARRWTEIPDDLEHVQLQTVGIGQEFVFDSADHDEQAVFGWVERVVRAGQQQVRTTNA